jgi:uncharacterized protein
MKSFLKILPAAGLLLALGMPANAQQKQAAPAGSPPALKQCSPSAKDAANEILKFKGASAMYTNIIPNLVLQTKEALLASNLNLQKDLNEVATIVNQSLQGKEKEVGEGMAQVFCNEFSEQELKDIVTFYKTPLGQKLLLSEPRAIQFSMSYMNQWAQNFAETVNGAFRAEMRKRGKQI